MIIHTPIIPMIRGGIMTHGGSIPMGGGGLVFIPITTIIILTIISEGEVILTAAGDPDFTTGPLGTEDLREAEAAALPGEWGEGLADDLAEGGGGVTGDEEGIVEPAPRREAELKLLDVVD
jgi:hypothetical protein